MTTPYTVIGLVVELTYLVGELNHQSTYLAELCKPPYFTIQADELNECIKFNKQDEVLSTNIGLYGVAITI